MRRWGLIAICLFAVTGISSQSSEAQRFVTRGESIAEALNMLVSSHSINLVYDPEMDLSALVFVDITSDDPADILRQILRGSILDFIILSTGTFVITRREGVVERYGSFIGYVYDEETGEPIENAGIFFADASVGAFTNENGYFSISRLLPGDYPVTVSSLGYEPARKTINIGDREGVNIIRLSPSMFMADPVIVQGEPMAFSGSRLARGVSGKRLLEQPGTSGSLFRSLNLFSGVSFNYGRNEMSIQGGNPSNYQIRLDGVPLHNTSRAGDPAGMFSPFAIDKVSVQKAGYSARYGGSLSGLIDFTHDLTDRNRASSVVIQADPNALNVRAEYSSESSPWDIALSARSQQPGRNGFYGYSSMYEEWNELDPLLQNFLMGSDQDIAHYRASVQQNALNYYDIHGIAVYRPDEYNKTSISGYFGKQSVETKLLSERATLISAQPDYVYSQENTDTYNWMGQISHSRVLSASTDLKAQVSISSSAYRSIYFMDGEADSMVQSLNRTEEQARILFSEFESQYSVDNSLSDENRITDVITSAELTQYLTSTNTLDLGLELRYIEYSFELKDLFYFPTRNTTSFSLLTAYASNKIFVSQNFWVDLGLRSTYSGSNQNFYLLPRISATFDTDKTLIGYHTFNIRGGVYRQFMNQYDIANIGPSALVPYNRFSTPVDESIDTPVSYQAAASWIITPSNSYRIMVEGYYKSEPRSYGIDYRQILTGPGSGGSEIMQQSEFLTPAKMVSYGAGLTVDIFLNDPDLHIKLVQQSSVSKQRIEGRFNERWNHTAWSEPIASSLFMTWSLTDLISVSYNLKWIPTRYWAFNRAYYDFLTTHNENNAGGFDFNDPDAQSLDDYFRMDLGLNYRIPVDQFSIKARVDLVNLTNRRNEVSYHLTPVLNEQQIEYRLNRRTLPGFYPTASLQVEF